jgi:uncharacterized protein
MMTYVAFTMGLIGSLHCLGMCGPIAFALPVRTNKTWLKAIKYAIYNSGRISSYAMLGLLMGFIGKGFALAGLQQVLSVFAGVVIIISVIFIYNPLKNILVNKITGPAMEKLKTAFHYYLKDSGWHSLFMIGLLNGLLPCGLVYAAIAGAIATGSAASGAIFMMAFGMGTVPVMMAVSLSKNIIGTRLKSIFNNVTPFIACLIGVLLIMRGLNMNIPFVSPSIKGGEVYSCH